MGRTLHTNAGRRGGTPPLAAVKPGRLRASSK
jgi:hypothetical protein